MDEVGRRLWATEECTEDDCIRAPIARNLCSMHYQRRKNAGTLPDKVRTAGQRSEPLKFQCAVEGCVVLAVAHGLCRRHYSRSRRYGMGLDELAKAEVEGCEVCGDPRTYVDHDHVTGEIRGALCRDCNTALGLMKDDLGRIVRLAAYLSEAERTSSTVLAESVGLIKDPT